MNYTVEWLNPAENDLARVWLDHKDDGDAINAAAERIHAELSVDAHAKGVPIDNFRAYLDRPLKVLFVVIPDDKQVWIVSADWAGN